MKGILKGIFVVLIVLGIVKTFEDHDLTQHFSQMYDQFTQRNDVAEVKDLNPNLSKIKDPDELLPADFF
ncbi:hypothetical protein [Staphylococcus auricularis]|uniref:Uncharacterized protein n=1 Tax=Staphylococcus auricularis TaxID=29379 RepID=A0ABX5IFJ1_9STAP|nr:hypothetical protein [Staphylococcus auricularis]MCE5038852.1 hypothetical protein [Staphylococcus auricularis]MEB6570654.1 hypothetical protein [Staphylococcus auricularis]PTH18908.1 hypothetical protein BU607_03605 [Staphylococcus auricularis]PTH24618.1 hypothetical protein BU608_10000 [Staphylococcus auricularis]